MFKIVSVLSIYCLAAWHIKAQEVEYPYPVKYFNPIIEGQRYQMAFMDVQPSNFNGRSVILFHGKNFNGLYWKDVISFLSGAGYRVIVPDQIGWGKSAKPTVTYTFEMLAQNNKMLLDSLQIDHVYVIGHSMGGMLATRFALLYPSSTVRLILEDPLGLEDYRKFIPYTTMEAQFKKESGATYASIKKYQAGYYPVWKPEYEKYVKAQAEPLTHKDFPAVAWVNALTYQMIYEQPVLYELSRLRPPTLLMAGSEDRTFIGKDLIAKEKQKLHGNFPQLAGKAKHIIKNCELIILPGVGHIPHVQTPALFNQYVLGFLSKK